MFAELAIELWRRDTILQKVKRMAHLVCRDLIQFSGLEVDHALNRTCAYYCTRTCCLWAREFRLRKLLAPSQRLSHALPCLQRLLLMERVAVALGASIPDTLTVTEAAGSREMAMCGGMCCTFLGGISLAPGDYWL